MLYAVAVALVKDRLLFGHPNLLNSCSRRRPNLLKWLLQIAILVARIVLDDIRVFLKTRMKFQIFTQEAAALIDVALIHFGDRKRVPLAAAQLAFEKTVLKLGGLLVDLAAAHLSIGFDEISVDVGLILLVGELVDDQILCSWAKLIDKTTTEVAA